MAEETFVVNDVKAFTLTPLLDNAPWDMTDGTVTFYLRSPAPAGVTTNYAATILSPGTSAQYIVATSVLNASGSWERWWKVIDANGIQETMPAEVFVVQATP